MNVVCITGNVSERIVFGQTSNETPVCTFMLASTRVSRSDTITVWVKVNAYAGWLVENCRRNLCKGARVEVTGELMNRSGPNGDLIEVRANNLKIYKPKEK